MKKITLIILTILMLVTVTKAETVTIIKPEGSVTMVTPIGREVTLLDLVGNIRWWKVITGGIDVIENKFIMPGINVEIKPMYTGNQIVVIQKENGTITPGTTETSEGENKTFLITANDGYEIEEVIVDNISQGKIESYTFSNIRENHVITAKYKLTGETTTKYTITTITDEGAEITGVYENHKCDVCGGYDHECEIINIFITTENAEVVEQE